MTKRCHGVLAETSDSAIDADGPSNEWPAIFDSIADPLMVLEPDLIIRRANQAAARFFNLPAESIFNRNCCALLHGDEPPVEDCPCRRTIATKSHEEAEMYLPGRNTWVLASSDPILDKDGNLSKIVHTLKDITSPKKAEHLLRSSEERYHSFFENSPISLIEIDARKAREHITDLHSSGIDPERYFECSTDRVLSCVSLIAVSDVNRAALDAFGVADKDEFIRKLDYAFTDGLIRTFKEALVSMSKDNYEFESTTIVGTPSGEKRHIYLKCNVPPRYRHDHDKVLVSIMDITPVKRSEQVLDEERSRLRTILDNAPFGIVITDIAGRGIYANEKLYEIFGYDFNEYPDWQTWSEKAYPDPEYRKKIMEEWVEGARKAKPGDRIVSYTRQVVCFDGTKKDVSIVSVRLRMDQFLFTCEDVTERKRRETESLQAQKMEAVNTLAAGIAKDMDDSLAKILGYAALLRRRLDPLSTVQETITSIESQAESGIQLTRQLLSFARGNQYQVKTACPNEILSRAAEAFAEKWKGIAIKRNFDEEPWSIEVDSALIEKVFVDFMINAGHSMPDGGEIYLASANLVLHSAHADIYSLKPGSYVRISITDTGLGLDEISRERIFEPFYSTRELGRGAGLGLASDYGIIKNHGGRITVYSEKDKGTTFNIYLPASGQADVEDSQRAHIIWDSADTETVLIVDDQPAVLEIGRAMLEVLGYNVLTAAGGREALRIYDEKSDKINIVILDMIMPEMGGEETFLELKEINAQIKVILTSGHNMNSDVLRILDQGCKGFIQKPFNIAELSWKIREVLGITSRPDFIPDAASNQ